MTPPPILPSALPQRRVLHGTRIVFSGVFPIQTPDIRETEEGRWAQRLGAELSCDLDASTTHLVATKAGTQKVHAASRMPHVHIVHLDWLWFSIYHCRRENEQSYQLLPSTEPALPAQEEEQQQEGEVGGGTEELPSSLEATPPPPLADTEQSESEQGSEGSSDDDAWAAELEKELMT